MKYQVRLSFTGVELPPFNDVLILGKNCSHGRHGVNRCLELLAPGRFEMFVPENEPGVEAIFINRGLLLRMPWEKILSRLKRKVLPYISSEEIIKVDFTIVVSS